MFRAFPPWGARAPNAPRRRCSVGDNVRHLVDRTDAPHCFRLHRERVFYVRYAQHHFSDFKQMVVSVVIPGNGCCSDAVMRRATNIARKGLVALGTCFGKFTKTGKFRLSITALPYLAPYARVGPRGGKHATAVRLLFRCSCLGSIRCG